MRRPGMNYLLAAVVGAGVSVYTFLPLIQARELERAKKNAESTELPEPSATRASDNPAVKIAAQPEVGKK
ncbi:hypothetical protein B0H12DRAFT_1095037 [Mycena haematopus]|nr:hypothetical protein B0H12DRAFT_1095037 [Mycena haematopus]